MESRIKQTTAKLTEIATKEAGFHTQVSVIKRKGTATGEWFDKVWRQLCKKSKEDTNLKDLVAEANPGPRPDGDGDSALVWPLVSALLVENATGQP